MPYFHDEERWILMMKVLSSLTRSGTSRNVLVSDYNSQGSVKPIIFEERKGYNFKEWQCTSLYLNSDVDKSKLNIHDCSIGWRPREASCHFNKKQDTSALTHLRSKLRVKISTKTRIKEL